MSSVPGTLRAASQPYSQTTTLQALDLTTDDAELPLLSGVHEICHSGADWVACSLAGSTDELPPASGAAGAAGWMIPPGGVVTVDAPTGPLHARSLSGTARLYVARKPLAP